MFHAPSFFFISVFKSFFCEPARPTVVLTVFRGGKLGGCFFMLR